MKNALLFGASVYLVSGVALVLLGLIIFRDNPRARVNRATAMMMFFGGIGPILGAIGLLIEDYAGTSSRLNAGPFQSFAYLWEFFFPALVVFALVFPAEHPLLRRAARLPLFVYLPHLVHFAIVLVVAGTFRAAAGEAIAEPGATLHSSLPGSIGRSLGPAQVVVGLLFRAHVALFSFVNLIYTGFALALLGASFRRAASSGLRRQIGLVLLGVGSAVGVYSGAVLVPILLRTELPQRFAMYLIAGSLVVGSVSIALAIVRERFLDVRMIVKRGILYTVASGVVIGTYLLVVRGLGRFADRFVGDQTPLVDIGFILLAVIAFQPVLSRMEEAVEGVLMRDHADHRNLLRRIGREITTILDLRRLADYVVESLADVLGARSVALFLVDADTGALRVLRSRGGIAEGEELEEAHPVRRAAARLSEIARVKALIASAATDGEAEEVARYAAERDVAMAVPLRRIARAGEPEDEMIGLVLLGEKSSGTRYTAEEVTLLSVLANQLGASLANALLHEQTLEKRLLDEELATARRIQTSLLPESCPPAAGFDIAALSVPSREVGGDYYDFIPMGDGTLGVAIGDVSGKGVPAALLMSMLRAGVRAQADGSLAVSRIVSRVNSVMFDSTSPERFATFFLGLLDAPGRRFVYTNAGHNYPLLLRRDGRIEHLDTGGLLLGVLGDAPYEERATNLDPGDLLLLYTDGLTEATDAAGEEFGEGRVRDILLATRERSATAIRDAFVEAVRDHAGESEQDDLTLIVMKAAAA